MASAIPDFSRFLAPDTFLELVSKGRLTHSFQDHGGFTLSPSTRLRDEAQRDLEDMAPTAGAEILLLQASPSRMPLDTREGELLLYNNMRSMSAMKGMTYFSSSKNQRVTLFRDSYVIESPRKQKRMEDPLVGDIPERDDLFIVQDDTTFGRNVYRAFYEHRDGMLSVKIENVDPISIVFLPLIRPGNLVLRFILTPSGDTMLFWGACYLRVELAPVGHTEIEMSLMNRLTAMAEWAVGRLR